MSSDYFFLGFKDSDKINEAIKHLCINSLVISIRFLSTLTKYTVNGICKKLSTSKPPKYFLPGSDIQSEDHFYWAVAQISARYSNSEVPRFPYILFHEVVKSKKSFLPIFNYLVSGKVDKSLTSSILLKFISTNRDLFLSLFSKLAPLINIISNQDIISQIPHSDIRIHYLLNPSHFLDLFQSSSENEKPIYIQGAIETNNTNIVKLAQDMFFSENSFYHYLSILNTSIVSKRHFYDLIISPIIASFKTFNLEQANSLSSFYLMNNSSNYYDPSLFPIAFLANFPLLSSSLSPQVFSNILSSALEKEKICYSLKLNVSPFFFFLKAVNNDKKILDFLFTITGRKFSNSELLEKSIPKHLEHDLQALSLDSFLFLYQLSSYLYTPAHLHNDFNFCLMYFALSTFLELIDIPTELYPNSDSNVNSKSNKSSIFSQAKKFQQTSPSQNKGKSSKTNQNSNTMTLNLFISSHLESLEKTLIYLDEPTRNEFVCDLFSLIFLVQEKKGSPNKYIFPYELLSSVLPLLIKVAPNSRVTPYIHQALYKIESFNILYHKSTISFNDVFFPSSTIVLDAIKKGNYDQAIKCSSLWHDLHELIEVSQAEHCCINGNSNVILPEPSEQEKFDTEAAFSLQDGYLHYQQVNKNYCWLAESRKTKSNQDILSYIPVSSKDLKHAIDLIHELDIPFQDSFSINFQPLKRIHYISSISNDKSISETPNTGLNNHNFKDNENNCPSTINSELNNNLDNIVDNNNALFNTNNPINNNTESHYDDFNNNDSNNNDESKSNDFNHNNELSVHNIDSYSNIKDTDSQNQIEVHFEMDSPLLSHFFDYIGAYMTAGADTLGKFSEMERISTLSQLILSKKCYSDPFDDVIEFATVNRIDPFQFILTHFSTDESVIKVIAPRFPIASLTMALSSLSSSLLQQVRPIVLPPSLSSDPITQFYNNQIELRQVQEKEQREKDIHVQLQQEKGDEKETMEDLINQIIYRMNEKEIEDILFQESMDYNLLKKILFSNNVYQKISIQKSRYLSEVLLCFLDDSEDNKIVKDFYNGLESLLEITEYNELNDTFETIQHNSRVKIQTLINEQQYQSYKKAKTIAKITSNDEFFIEAMSILVKTKILNNESFEEELKVLESKEYTVYQYLFSFLEENPLYKYHFLKALPPDVLYESFDLQELYILSAYYSVPEKLRPSKPDDLLLTLAKTGNWELLSNITQTYPTLPRASIFGFLQQLISNVLSSFTQPTLTIMEPLIKTLNNVVHSFSPIFVNLKQIPDINDQTFNEQQLILENSDKKPHYFCKKLNKNQIQILKDNFNIQLLFSSQFFDTLQKIEDNLSVTNEEDESCLSNVLTQCFIYSKSLQLFDSSNTNLSLIQFNRIINFLRILDVYRPFLHYKLQYNSMSFIDQTFAESLFEIIVQHDLYHLNSSLQHYFPSFYFNACCEFFFISLKLGFYDSAREWFSKLSISSNDELDKKNQIDLGNLSPQFKPLFSPPLSLDDTFEISASPIENSQIKSKIPSSRSLEDFPSYGKDNYQDKSPKLKQNIKQSKATISYEKQAEPKGFIRAIIKILMNQTYYDKNYLNLPSINDPEPPHKAVARLYFNNSLKSPINDEAINEIFYYLGLESLNDDFTPFVSYLGAFSRYQQLFNELENLDPVLFLPAVISIISVGKWKTLWTFLNELDPSLSHSEIFVIALRDFALYQNLWSILLATQVSLHEFDDAIDTQAQRYVREKIPAKRAALLREIRDAVPCEVLKLRSVDLQMEFVTLTEEHKLLLDPEICLFSIPLPSQRQKIFTKSEKNKIERCMDRALYFMLAQGFYGFAVNCAKELKIDPGKALQKIVSESSLSKNTAILNAVKKEGTNEMFEEWITVMLQAMNNGPMKKHVSKLIFKEVNNPRLQCTLLAQFGQEKEALKIAQKNNLVDFIDLFQ